MKRLKKIILGVGLGLAGLWATASSALAADPVTIVPMPSQIQVAPGPNFSGLLGITVVSLITGAIRLVLIGAALVFFFVLVIGGIQWITSGGDKAGSEAARKRITNALIGLAIVFAAWAIIQLIQTLFGVDIVNLTIPTFIQSEQTQ